MTALFAATLFLSALLLFAVQPMFAKMVLPRLGGTPAVWTTCVVFFQLALLAGYAYTHLSVRWLGIRRQAILHVVLLTLPLLALPIAIGPEWTPPSATTPVYWLLLVLAAVVGPPFLAVSTLAPLLQRWFAGTEHPRAMDPFFLYAASNLGSLGALLAYPLVIEPFLPLEAQSRVWAVGYVVLIGCVTACAWTARRAAGRGHAPGTPVLHTAPADWRTRGLWLALAAVPSSLMLSVTTYVSTDIAAVPLLWVIPLALYLITFVIVFGRRPPAPSGWVTRLFPVIIVLPAIAIVMRATPPLAGIPIHFLAFFTAALACHGRLARLRPEAHRLTEFYLWMSAGGAVGGLFNTLVAPAVFVSTAEYPLGLVLACLLCLPSRGPTPAAAPRMAVTDVLVAAGVAGGTWGLLYLAQSREALAEWTAFGRTFAIPFALVLLSWRRPFRFALTLGAVLLAHQAHSAVRFPVVHAERTFFGQLQVVDRGAFRLLTHGTTNHGAQSLAADLRCEPTAYYTRTSPVGQLFGSFVGEASRQHVGIIGLGTGSLASYARQGQRWTFFEINPSVVRFSERGRYFSYLRDCVQDPAIVLGDARLRLAELPDAAFDVLVIDAFSSDAIPVHLMTEEALRLYLRKLTPGGVMAFHISNRYLDFEPVLSALARRLSLFGRLQSDYDTPPGQRRVAKWPSIWVVLARDAAHVGVVADDPRWRPLGAAGSAHLWRDDFSNIVRTIRWVW